MSKDEKIDEIIEVLSRQKFADFYNHGTFSDWISGDSGKEKVCVEEKMRKEIANLFSRVL